MSPRWTRAGEILAVAFWTFGGWVILPMVGINPWWSIYVAWAAGGIFLAAFAFANQLSRIAGARWLERAQEAKLPGWDPDELATWVADELAKAEAAKTELTKVTPSS